MPARPRQKCIVDGDGKVTFGVRPRAFASGARKANSVVEIGFARRTLPPT